MRIAGTQGDSSLGEYTLKPIQLVTAKEQIKNVLRDAILSNEFKRGDTLNVAEIANQLGVSAMPVREALSVLERDGLVELRPRKTAVVLGADEQYIRDYYRIRALLEGEAALQASIRGGEKTDTLRRILEISAQACEENDLQLFSEMNTAFHQTIGEMSGNRRLELMLKDLWMSKAILQRSYTGDDMHRTAKAHEHIAQCIFEKRGEDARKAMGDHLNDGLKVLLRQFNEGNKV